MISDENQERKNDLLYMRELLGREFYNERISKAGFNRMNDLLKLSQEVSYISLIETKTMTTYYKTLIKLCWYGIFLTLSIAILIQLVAFVFRSFTYLISIGG